MTDRQKLMKMITGNPDLVSRLLVCAEGNCSEIVTSAEDAFGHFSPMLSGRSREHFAVMALNNRRRVLGCEVLTIGNDGFCIVDPRQVYTWALRQGKLGANAVIIAHNHPSGNPNPSRQDIEVTRRVVRAGEVLGIPLLDHLIIGGTTFTSLAEEGQIRG